MGVPFVATDVGACSELAQGRTEEDQALGVGGLITPIATPGETAKAIEALAKDRATSRAMGEIMRQRVQRYYALETMIESYREIYKLGTSWRESVSS